MVHVGAYVAALILSLASVAWSTGNRCFSSSNSNPEYYSTAFVHLGSLLITGYMVFSSFYIYLYRTVHYCRLSTFKSSESVWDDNHVDDWTFRQAWDFDKVLIFVLSLVGFGNTLYFALTAFCSWSVMVPHKMALSRLVLTVSTVLGVALGLETFFWTLEAETWMDYPQVEGMFSTNYLTGLQILIVVSLIILVFNLIIMLLNKRKLYFLLSLLTIVLGVITLIVAGLLLRQWRQS